MLFVEGRGVTPQTLPCKPFGRGVTPLDGPFGTKNQRGHPPKHYLANLSKEGSPPFSGPCKPLGRGVTPPNATLRTFRKRGHPLFRGCEVSKRGVEEEQMFSCGPFAQDEGRRSWHVNSEKTLYSPLDRQDKSHPLPQIGKKRRENRPDRQSSSQFTFLATSRLATTNQLNNKSITTNKHRIGCSPKGESKKLNADFDFRMLVHC